MQTHSNFFNAYAWAVFLGTVIIVAVTGIAVASAPTVSSPDSMSYLLQNAPSVRIESGSMLPYLDTQGNLWLGETFYTDGPGGGMVDRGPIPIARTTDPRIFQTEHHCVDRYTLPVPNGTYTVKLYFAETDPTVTGAGQRVFDLNVGGQSLTGFDVYAQAGGSNIALVKTFNAVPVTAGNLLIAFTRRIKCDIVNGIEIVANGPNQPPAVNAGSDQTIKLPNSAELNGSASDDGLPPGSTMTTTWSKVSGPGTVTVANPGALHTTASFSTAGTYVLRLTAFDGQLSNTDDVTITVSAPSNQEPFVDAGPAQTITSASTTLAGTASDDGLPAGSHLTTTWSKVDGPGTVTFGDVSALRTTASFSTAGTYVLRLTASDGELSSTDEVAINVSAAPPGPGVLTIVTPLTLDKTAVGAGDILNATVTYKNTGGSAITVNRIIIAGRPPGATNSGGPHADFSPELETTTVEPGATLQVSASRQFTSADPLGTWYSYVTYKDSSSVWHDGPSVNFNVVDNSTKLGALSMSATFENISVRAAFSNDFNANNTATIQFRKQGDAAWKQALNPIVDRRSKVAGTNNPYVGQVRGSIVGLTPGTTYEVAVQFADPDGLSNSATLTGTVTTLTSAPPLSGRQIFVDDVDTNGDGSSAAPFNSITTALNAATAGDTIVVRPGTYEPFTVSRSGTASGYIAIVGESRDDVFISGGSGDSIDVNGNYIMLKNLRLKLPGRSGIVIDGYHHVWIDNIYIDDLFTTQYYDAGVSIKNANDVYVLNSQIYAPSLTALPAANPRWESTGEGVFVGANVRNLVLRSNTIIGGYLDCIGNSLPEGWGGGAMDNSDIAYNTISGCKDDGIQMEGDDVNLRIYGNRVTADNGYSALALAPHLAGPVYVFRNVLQNTAGFGGYAVKLDGGSGFAFFFHNTLETTQDNDGVDYAGSNEVLFNNILKVAGHPLYGADSGGTYNGNLYDRVTQGPIVRKWKGDTDFNSVADFRNATGKEPQGRQGDPGFMDAERHVSPSSPAFDAGIVIPNFNDAGSAWPFKGNRPDIGAFEVP